jgi:hypothetical protein
MPVKRGSVAAPLAAIVSSLAAASCCLPLGYFLTAAGLFGGAGVLDAGRPYLIGLSLVALAAGFTRVYTRSSCRAERSVTAVVVLWSAAVFVLLMFLFPQEIAGLLADITGSSS